MPDGEIAIVIPAAGQSRRLGRAKQLEVVNGTSLLRAAAERAMEAGVGPVLVAVGFRADDCRREVEGLGCEVIEAVGWEDGMSASVRAGARWAMGRQGIAALMVVLVDQWKLEVGDLRQVARAWRDDGRTMAAAQYDGVLGVPAVFGRALLPELEGLSGDKGARGILLARAAEVTAVELARAAEDFDQ